MINLILNINSYSFKAIYVLLLCLSIQVSIYAATPKECDKIIKKGIDAMWKKDHVKSLELFTLAKNIAKKNHWNKQLFIATNNIGANYSMMLDYGEALKYYIESYNIALEHLDSSYEMQVVGNIAILYSNEKNYDKAKEYFTKAYNIAKENRDSYKIGTTGINLGFMLNEMGNTTEARKYILKSLPYLKHDANSYALGLTTLAQNDMKIGNIRQAHDSAVELLKTTPDLNFNNIGDQLYLIIIEASIKEGNYDRAQDEINKLLVINKNNATRKSLFEFLSTVYTKKGKFQLALQFKDSVLKTEILLNDVKNGRSFENNRVKFEIQDYKNQISLNEAKLSNERKVFYSILAFVMVIIIMIIYFFRNLSHKHKQKKLIAERHEKMLALELEKEKTDNLLEQERLKNEIEVRNRKLSAKALYFSGRNRLIEEVILSLSQVSDLSKNHAITKQINTLKGHLRTDDEWDDFINHFEEVNHHFITQLKTLHPSLTSNDIRFISYIYMNLTPKEISSIFNITDEACRQRKKRIAHKMNLPETTSLYDYISAI